MTTVFLIHGFSLNTTTADEEYSELREAIQAKGYKVITTPILWNRKTVSTFTKEFVNFYAKNKTEKNIVIGNSLGAMVAFISATAIKPDEVYLCSLSPFFKEDIEREKYSDKELIGRFGKRRATDMKQLSATRIAEQLNDRQVKVTLFYGEEEITDYPNLGRRVEDTAKALKNARLIKVPQGPHQFRKPVYVRALTENL